MSMSLYKTPGGCTAYLAHCLHLWHCGQANISNRPWDLRWNEIFLFFFFLLIHSFWHFCLHSIDYTVYFILLFLRWNYKCFIFLTLSSLLRVIRQSLPKHMKTHTTDVCPLWLKTQLLQWITSYVTSVNSSCLIKSWSKSFKTS